MATGRTPKSRNGEGLHSAFLVECDLTEPAQARAWAVAQRKAANHGARKHLMIAFLNAVADFEDSSGREMTADMLSGFMLAQVWGQVVWGTQVPANPPTPIPADEIIIMSAQKKTAQESAGRFVGGVGNLFT